MNDLDLRAALHRDADLAGEPAPDLLDQLVRRRVHQRRRRTAVLVAVAGILVIGAGIPAGQSFLTSSDTRPATQTTTAPTPSPSPEIVPTVPATPSFSVAPVAPETPVMSVAPETPVTSAAPAITAGPTGCPTLKELEPALPPDNAERSYVFHDPLTKCSGKWAVAFPTEMDTPTGQVGFEFTELFHYVDGAWIGVPRAQPCAAGEVPDAIWELACNTN